MISHELPPSMGTLNLSKLAIVVVITRGNFLFGILPTLSLNPSLNLSYFSLGIVSHSQITTISLEILLLIIPLDGFFGRGGLPWWTLCINDFPQSHSPLSLLYFLSLVSFITSIFFLGDIFYRWRDHFFLGNSPRPLYYLFLP